MSLDIEIISVLPESWHQDIYDNFSPEYLSKRLSDYIVELKRCAEIIRKDVHPDEPSPSGYDVGHAWAVLCE